MPETFLEEMKRYIGVTAEDAATLAAVAPLVEPYLPAMADAFYEQIPRHSHAAAVFTGGEPQIARLKLTLQRWARGLLSGVYDEAYADERFRIGYRHVQIGLAQRYVIAAMHVVRRFLHSVLEREIDDLDRRRRAQESLDRVIVLDLTLISETYVEGSLRELKHLNDRLTSTNRALENANRVKADFLATTSHELRTPLTSIIGFSRLLLDGYVADPAEQRELTTDVHRSALHLLSLVDDILDLSRIESGHLEIALESVDLAGLVTELTASTKAHADAKGLTLAADVPDGVPAVRIDRLRMRQVLLNVIGNAIKFTEHGAIRVSASSDSHGTRVRIDVTDTGIGIAHEQQSMLFEKFRQIDASHTRRHGGTGLGLAISKALLERMGGSIRLRSSGRGMGTTVSLVIPAVTQPGTEDGPGALNAQGSTPSVLLMAPDAQARRTMAAALSNHGYRVREGATADGVRALAHMDRPDLLLIDLTGGAGLEDTRECVEVLVALHADPAMRTVKPVVLIDRPLDAATRVELALLPDARAFRRTLAGFASASGTAPLRLLVAGDDPALVTFVNRELPSHEYVVLHAAGGTEALRAIDTQPIDAVLLDLRMPDKSGYDVIRALKLEGRAPDLPLLVITTYPAPVDAEEQALLPAPLVLDVFPRSAIAAPPEALLEQLEAVRRRS